MELYSKFVLAYQFWSEIGQKMADGRLLFQALVVGTYENNYVEVSEDIRRVLDGYITD